MDGTHAMELLRRLIGDPGASFRADQLEAIRALVADRRRVLVVQRTGWGKSAVYFIATRLLRDRGSGPTLVISPLLALMRNQIDAAQRMGVHAATINSTNHGEWSEVAGRVEADEVDVLFISPERLANRQFRETVLDRVGRRASLVVVDEVHCISEWGHDFRPDYRRIRRVLELLPPNVPVMACTATANDRVVEDVVRQLGGDLAVFRGPLARRGLALQVVDLDAPAARLVWLATTVPRLPGSGIIYCLTVGDADMVAAWLCEQGIRAISDTAASDDRVGIEEDLLTNEVDVVVATSALGMGFDKPDLASVIHYQSPGSVITYYQQVGRAGRQLPESFGVLLRGREDVDIQDWFINTAFPTAGEAVEVLASLERHDGYMKLAELEERVNIRRSRLALLLKNLEVDGVVAADGQRYLRTTRPYAYDVEHVEAVTALRRAEQQQMRDYVTLSSGCRMAFLAAALDDPHAEPCGICDLCASPPLPIEVDASLAGSAASFLRRRPVVIEARRVWPDRRTIPVDRRTVDGRALCRWGDGGWSELVARGKQVDGRFDEQLVTALADLVRGWQPHPDPAWITWVPSLDHPVLVAHLAAGVGEALALPAVEAVVKVKATEPQKTMQNSAQQLANNHRGVCRAWAAAGRSGAAHRRCRCCAMRVSTRSWLWRSPTADRHDCRDAGFPRGARADEPPRRDRCAATQGVGALAPPRSGRRSVTLVRPRWADACRRHRRHRPRCRAARPAPRHRIGLAVRLDALYDRGISVVTVSDDTYPTRLRARLGSAAPPVLYYAGDLSLLGVDGIGIVGSRDVGPDAAEVTSKVARQIADAGLTLVSGGAKGVDAIGMASAYEAGATVVGVLAGSLDRAIGRRDDRAAVLDGRVCLCTPYRPDAGFTAGSAMGRNKIIYGLSRVTIVVASVKGEGGTWSGATEALKKRYGRVAVWMGTGAGPGNAALVDACAVAIDEPEQLLDIPAVEESAGPADTQLALNLEPPAPAG